MIQRGRNYTVSPQKTCDYIFYNNFNNRCPITIIFGIVSSKSFTYASPHLWNQLLSSFRQPHSVHSPPGSPHPAHITLSVTTFALTIYHSLDLSLIIIIVTRSVQPEPPAIAIVCQNGRSSASCRASVISNQYLSLQTSSLS